MDGLKVLEVLVSFVCCISWVICSVSVSRFSHEVIFEMGLFIECS